MFTALLCIAIVTTVWNIYTAVSVWFENEDE